MSLCTEASVEDRQVQSEQRNASLDEVNSGRNGETRKTPAFQTTESRSGSSGQTTGQPKIPPHYALDTYK